MSQHLPLAGHRFSLKAETCGIEFQERNERIVVLIPAGSVVAVEPGSGPIEEGMVLVRWDGRELAMFVEDLEARGEIASPRNT
jgi:hypothetical protein